MVDALNNFSWSHLWNHAKKALKNGLTQIKTWWHSVLWARINYKWIQCMRIHEPKRIKWCALCSAYCTGQDRAVHSTITYVEYVIRLSVLNFEHILKSRKIEHIFAVIQTSKQVVHLKCGKKLKSIVCTVHLMHMHIWYSYNMPGMNEIIHWQQLLQ